jgi:predicted deacetylase
LCVTSSIFKHLRQIQDTLSIHRLQIEVGVKIVPHALQDRERTWYLFMASHPVKNIAEKICLSERSTDV